MAEGAVEDLLETIAVAIGRGQAMYLLDADDLGMVAMSAAAWVMGLPVERNDNLPGLVDAIERVAAEVGVSFKNGWWEATDG